MGFAAAHACHMPHVGIPVPELDESARTPIHSANDFGCFLFPIALHLGRSRGIVGNARFCMAFWIQSWVFHRGAGYLLRRRLAFLAVAGAFGCNYIVFGVGVGAMHSRVVAMRSRMGRIVGSDPAASYESGCAIDRRVAVE